jgi:transposase InsO family protein
MYILHVRDYASRFSWLRPLVSKEAPEVAEKLEELFSGFGPPVILQSDNGSEFVSAACIRLCERYDEKFVNGRSRHPQSQGMSV